MNQPPNFSTAEIERIVRLVVQRLVRDGAAKSSSTEEQQPTPSQASSSTTARPSGELRLDSRLITLDALDGKLGQHVTTLCVPTKAVVTPAVRDELRVRGIELRRADVADCGTSPLGPKVIVATKPSIPAAWTSPRSEKVGSLPQAVERSASVAKQDQMAVLLTDQPETAACAANRQTGVRALVACGHGDWKAAVSALGANLVVCDPAHWNEQDVPKLLATLWNLRTAAGPTWIQ